MAKPRDTLYTATRRLNVVQVLQGSEPVVMAMFLTAIQEQMSEVAAKMRRDGARPNPNELPELVLTFESKGGSHHVPQDQ